VETCHGGGKYEDKLTVLLGCNVEQSEKLCPHHVVDKFEKPQCMKNTNIKLAKINGLL
jgi:CRISPR/Cas system CMR-associated protein Cmr3 (group 5 of RAMP superfamily)